MPVKAGTRTISATFLKDTVLPEGIVLPDREQAFFEGVGSISVAGPYNAAGPGATPSRERIFICRPASASEERPCAEKIIATLARRAYRRPVSDERSSAASDGSTTTARNAAGSRRAFSWRFRRSSSLRSSSSASSSIPKALQPGSVHRVSDIELASRLSFFLWSSIPDDELLALAERGELKNEAVLEAAGEAHARRSALAVARNEFRRPMAVLAQHRAYPAGPGGVPEFRRQSARRAEAGDRAPDREHAARGQERRRAAGCGLHLRQSAARRALRHRGHLRQRVPARAGQRRETARPARAREHPDGDVLSQPHRADDPRQMGAGAAPGHAAAAAAAQRSHACGERRRRRA